MARVDIHAIRREQIIAVAERLIAHKGWAGTTFADICKEAGISNGVLTYHFKDKDEILYAVLEKVGREANTTREEMQNSFCEKLLLLVRQTLDCSEKGREMGLLSLHFFSLAAQRPEFAGRMRKIQDCAVQQLQGEIGQAIQDGKIEGRDPARIATVLQMVFLGLSFGSLAYDFQIPDEQLMGEVMLLFKRYLGMQDEELQQEQK
jgi:AcrR family transcriptional regulator